MNLEEIIYLSEKFSNIVNLPVRIFQNNKEIYWKPNLNFAKDPCILENSKINDFNKEIGYITNEDFFNYGILKYKTLKIIFGPFRLKQANEQIISKMAFNLELNKKNARNFIYSMLKIHPISLEKVLEILSLFYFVLTKSKKTIKDILLNEQTASNLKEELENSINDIPNKEYENNSFLIETQLLKMVEEGDVESLKDWFKNIPHIKPGILSSNILRQTKNIFIVTATLLSRSAIKGNLDPVEAMSISDIYIQQMENLQSVEEVYSLQMNMALDFTTKISKIKRRKKSSPLLISINKYILNHLSDSIKSKDICKSLFISKSQLFKKIKKETGKTLSNYILEFKINESKYLILNSNKSFLNISIYLGFSSPSHFDHTFKKYIGMSPKEFKRKNKI